MLITASGRLPRFKRMAGQVAPVQLTPRDHEIIRQVGRHRFLRSSHIASLVGGSAQHVLRRLQALYHLGYLERPKCQIDYYHRTGSQPLVYGLGRKGASLLAALHAGASHRHDWNDKHPHVGRLFLEHTLAVSDFMVSLELACRSRGDIRLLAADELPLTSTAKHLREPCHWSVTLSSNQKTGVVPDVAFALERMRADGSTERSLYFLEADRATMPVRRRSLSSSSVFRKLLAYEATWSQGIHRKRFDCQRLRVLTVTSSPKRTASLASACRKLRSGHGLFLFTDAVTLKSGTDFFELPWMTATGETSGLLD